MHYLQKGPKKKKKKKTNKEQTNKTGDITSIWEETKIVLSPWFE